MFWQLYRPVLEPGEEGLGLVALAVSGHIVGDRNLTVLSGMGARSDPLAFKGVAISVRILSTVPLMDDIQLPQKVAAGVTFLAQHPSDQTVLVGGRTFVCDHALRKLQLSRRPDHRQIPSFRHARVQSFAGGTKMIFNAAAARLLCDAAHEARRIVMHDGWAYHVMGGAGGIAVYGPAPDVMYRQHPRNLFGDNRGIVAEMWRMV